MEGGQRLHALSYLHYRICCELAGRPVAIFLNAWLLFSMLLLAGHMEMDQLVWDGNALVPPTELHRQIEIFLRIACSALDGKQCQLLLNLGST